MEFKMARCLGQWNLLNEILRERSFGAAFDFVHMTLGKAGVLREISILKWGRYIWPKPRAAVHGKQDVLHLDRRCKTSLHTKMGWVLLYYVLLYNINTTFVFLTPQLMRRRRHGPSM